MTTPTQDTQDEFSAAVLRALETPPQIAAPQDFAARVMGRIPQVAKPRPRFANAVLTAPDYGRKAIFVALGLLLALMLVITPATRTSSTWMTFQMVLLTQFGVLVLWLGFGGRFSRQ